MFRALKHFLFDHQYFSPAEYEEQCDQIARDAGSRPCRGNVSSQTPRILMEAQVVREAMEPI